VPLVGAAKRLVGAHHVSGRAQSLVLLKRRFQLEAGLVRETELVEWSAALRHSRSRATSYGAPTSRQCPSASRNSRAAASASPSARSTRPQASCLLACSAGESNDSVISESSSAADLAVGASPAATAIST